MTKLLVAAALVFSTLTAGTSAMACDHKDCKHDKKACAHKGKTCDHKGKKCDHCDKANASAEEGDKTETKSEVKTEELKK